MTENTVLAVAFALWIAFGIPALTYGGSSEARQPARVDDVAPRWPAEGSGIPRGC